MRELKWIVLITLFLLGGRNELISQTLSTPSNFQVLASINPSDTNYAFGDSLFFSVNSYSGTAVITLVDTTGISKINFYLGSINGTWNMLSKAFTFDSAGTFMDGTSYYRQGYNVYLGVGNYSGQDSIYSKVTLQNGGTLSSSIFYRQAISTSLSPISGIDTTTIFH